MSSLTATTLDFSLPLAKETPQERFEALVAGYSPDLYRYAFWLCRNREVAEDLVQETFLRAWRSLDSVRDEKAIKAWLLTILRRENARLYERFQPDFDKVEPEALPGGDRYDTSTEAFVLRQALEDLPLKYREPLVLQVLAGHSCQEIGEILGLSPGAVMTRVFRAKQKLRAILDGAEKDDEAEG